MTTFYTVLETTIADGEIEDASVWNAGYATLEEAQQAIKDEWKTLQEEDDLEDGVQIMEPEGNGTYFLSSTDCDRIEWSIYIVTLKGNN